MTLGESAVRDGRAATYLCVRVNANAQAEGSGFYPGGSWDEWWMPTTSSAPARSRHASAPSAPASSTTGVADIRTSRSRSQGSPSATSGPGLTWPRGPGRPGGFEVGAPRLAITSMAGGVVERTRSPRPRRVRCRCHRCAYHQLVRLTRAVRVGAWRGRPPMLDLPQLKRDSGRPAGTHAGVDSESAVTDPPYCDGDRLAWSTRRTEGRS
mgnify:CR=1 FL=1